MAIKSHNLDFGVSRNRITPKTGKVPLKKAVASGEKMPKNLTPDKTLKIKPIKNPEVKPDANPEQKTIKPVAKRSYGSVIPVTALAVLIAIFFQSLTYLNTARSASGTVLGAATSAYDDLDAANKSLEERDFGSAKHKFSSAQQNLANAQSELDKFRLLTMVAPPARSADDILTGAFFLAEAGKNLTYAMQLFDELSVNSEGISTSDYSTKLEQNKNLLKNSLLMISYAEDKFNSAKSLPDGYEETLKHAKDQIALLKGVLTDLVNLEDLFLSFFGSAPKTYLLVFQNYDEIRATGGFLGTYGVLKYNNGRIDKLKIESIYNIDGSLTKQIAAPGPFQPDIKKWGLRDANWFADFPTSARKMLEFFEMESETADGIISLTPEIFVDILRLIGNVEMPDYDVVLTPENFQDVVQEQTSVVYDKKLNQPKKFLDDFAPIMLDRLSTLKKEQWFEFFQIVKDSFAQKHALVYSTDSNTQKKIENLGFDGRILETESDYLAIINSNHGGTKTDLDVKQSAKIYSAVSKDGSVINTLTITRTNTSDLNNRNFARILVPKGSILISSSGFSDEPQFQSTSENFATDPDLEAWDVFESNGSIKTRSEAGKTEFTGWIQTPGKSETKVTITYLLPFKVRPGLFRGSEDFSLLFQKQPGNLETTIEGEWVFESGDPIWSSERTAREGKTVRFSEVATTDKYWAAVIR
ncbi:MAG TPA: DUF4012 domain-containing protein [Candidatus Binatia bacterium]|nr:DUF4012 domain-containing protein [Candidatus Binatia bacterium]